VLDPEGDAVSYQFEVYRDAALSNKVIAGTSSNTGWIVPVVLPDRATPELCATLSRTRLRVVVVLHANHPAEIDFDVAASAGRLRKAGVQLLNQSVLLAGVNDDAIAESGAPVKDRTGVDLAVLSN